MILQLGGSISFAPEPGEEAHFQSYDSRHKLAEINPKPDQVTVACGTSLYDLTALHPVEEFQGTRLANPAMLHAMANLVGDSTPDFYLENIKRLVQNGIQPYFALMHVHGLELVERLIRKGYYTGPVNGFFSIGGRGHVRRKSIRPDGANSSYTARIFFYLPDHTPSVAPSRRYLHRAGPTYARRHRGQPLEHHEGRAHEHDPNDRTPRTDGQGAWPRDCHPEQARQMLKIGVTYKSTEETLANLGLPPNRRPGNMGFMVHETDGRFHPAAQGGCGHIHAGDWEEKIEVVNVATAND